MARLKRTLGLWQLTAMGVGIIIGAGIYVLIGQAAGLAGNALWISFLLAALAAIFTGLSYAKMSALLPKAGAEYAYVRKMFDNRLAWMVGWLLLLNGFICAATVALGFSNYFSAIFGTPVILTALTLIILATILLFTGMKDSAKLAILFTLIETSGLIIIIFLGIPYLGSVNYMEMANGFTGVLGAGSLIFFAFMGFETITRLSEETRNPRKTVPKAVILSIAITTIIYILVAIAAISILGWETLSQSQSPMATIAEKAFGNQAFLILSLIAMFSTANTVIVILLTTSRLIYGIAEFGTIPKIFRSISEKNNSPWAAIIATALPSMAFILVGDIKTIANLANFTIFITFIMVNACAMKMCLKTKKVSLKNISIIPVLGILTCLFMMTGLGLDILAYGVVLTALGLLLYQFVQFEINHSHMEKNYLRRKHHFHR